MGTEDAAVPTQEAEMHHNMSEHERWMASVCAHLNRLVQLDVDAVCTYREALLHVDDRTVRADLHVFLADHERHIRELSAVISDLGGTPIDAHRDLKGAVLETMTRMRSRGTLGALRAMRMNERITNRRYDKACDLYMPPIGQAIVLQNLGDERHHLATIEAHIDRITREHAYDLDRIDREASDERPYAR